MFSGIVEVKSRVLDCTPENQDGTLSTLTLEKPTEFKDIKLGDSIAVNGVCLTVEKFDDHTMQFALGAETLKITGWSAATLVGQTVNLERSLKLGDRIHGHLVAGHVDGLGEVVRVSGEGSLFLDVRVPADLKPFVFKKGSVALNGVSLTINEVRDDVISVCLIPETLRRTNLGDLVPGARVNVEVDQMARAIHRLRELHP